MKDLILRLGANAQKAQEAVNSTAQTQMVTNIFEQITNLSTLDIILSIVFTTILAGVMYIVYRKVHTKMNYDENFNLMLVMLAFITTILMMLIRTNIALSLGMLGSLSLVRFRTNIKDSRDIGFVFWAMTIGMAGANQAYILGIILSLILGGVLIYANKTAVDSDNILLIIRGNEIDVDVLVQDITAYTNNFSLRAHNLMEDSFEIVYEVKATPLQQQRLSQLIKHYEGVDTVNLLAPSAEMA